MHDAIIIGGSFAGLAAATQFGRARRDVLVLDTELPRNRFSPAAHGLLGQEGHSPAEILAAARRQLAAYSTVAVERAEAVSAARRDDAAFTVETAAGEVHAARQLILAHGVTDQLPDIPGFGDCWGLSVLHCPYCHGYEFADRRLGLLLRQGLAVQRARFYSEWSRDLTIFTDGEPVDDLVRGALRELGAGIDETSVLRLEHEDGRLRTVVTAAGERPLDALFAHPRTAFSCNIGVDLGCAVAEGVTGPYFTVDGMHRTSVAGVYAAGDIARPAHNLSYAIADGAGAGICAHQERFEDR
jgi:thioredoxin reductase